MNKVDIYKRLTLAGAVVVLLLLVGLFTFPKPNDLGLAQRKSQEEKQLKHDFESARATLSELRNANEARMFLTKADEIGPNTMRTLESAARQRNLKVISFRPQRTEEDSGVTRYPYQIALEGSYLDVIAFVRSMETPATKLGVTSMQIASSDGATDKVSAMIGIVAYGPVVDEDKESETGSKTKETSPTTPKNP